MGCEGVAQACIFKACSHVLADIEKLEPTCASDARALVEQFPETVLGKVRNPSHVKKNAAGVVLR